MKDVGIEVGNSPERPAAAYSEPESGLMDWRRDLRTWLSTTQSEIDIENIKGQLGSMERRMKKYNIHLKDIPEADHRWNLWEANIEKMMAENYSESKRYCLQIDARGPSSRVNKKKSIPSGTADSKYKENLSSSQEKTWFPKYQQMYARVSISNN